MRLPAWIRGQNLTGSHQTKNLIRRHGLSTVCEEARCPNRGRCFSKPTATFMILGRSCTRNCGFCSVESLPPGPPDPYEPQRVADAARELGLKYVVVTSVTRDDLPDGGAAHFAMTVRALRQRLPDAKVEVLTPDFLGSSPALRTVLESSPDVFNHNMETVRRLYKTVRPGADYDRSLMLLRRAKQTAPSITTKSGFMLGLGEAPEEIYELMGDLRLSGCDILTIGQYLRPTRKNLPVVEYPDPGVFEGLRIKALDMGFIHAASGPLVRSSMNAEEMYGHV
ncbi:MAG: lipoyl synthase [Nitrospirae bacterium]|nr:lipoyl synthase [Nitrospirota bacterium]